MAETTETTTEEDTREEAEAEVETDTRNTAAEEEAHPTQTESVEMMTDRFVSISFLTLHLIKLKEIDKHSTFNIMNYV